MSIEQRLEQVERQTKRLRIAVVVLATALCGVVSMAAKESKVGRFDMVIAKSIYVESDKGNLAVALEANKDGNGVVSTFNPMRKKLVSLGATVESHGVVSTYYGATGKELVSLGVTVASEGIVTTYGPTGKELVALNVTTDGNGSVVTHGLTGKKLVELTASPNGGNGNVYTYGPTGKKLVNLSATTSGTGVVTTYGLTGKKLVELTASPNGGYVAVKNNTDEEIITLRADNYGNGEVGAWNRKGKGRVWSSQ